MKELLIYLLLLLFAGVSAFSQKIQYSRGTFQNIDPNNTQLVSNIDGHHHLLTFTLNKKPTIQVFNPQLQLLQKKQIGFSVTENVDIKAITLENNYFLYTHGLQSPKHDIFKIDKEGNSVSLSKKFQKVIDSVFGQYTATFQMIEREKRVCLLAHTYFDTIKSIMSTAVELDDNLDVLSVRKVVHPFNRETDHLQQANIIGNELYVLRTSRSVETGNSLEIVKTDLNTGKSLANSFHSGWHVYLNPGFVFTGTDSTILLYAQLRNSSTGGPQQRTVFITKLHSDLREKVPVSLLKSQFGQNISASFLFLEGQQPLWLNLYSGMRIQRALTHNYWLDTLGALNIRRPSTGYLDRTAYSQYTGIRFTLLDEALRYRRDSVIKNDRNLAEVRPYPFAQLRVNDNGALVLIRNYSVRRKGLIIMCPEGQEHFSYTNVPVYDRYDYLLSQLQQVNDYFIVPYMAKNEMGLLKVTMNDQYNNTSKR